MKKTFFLILSLFSMMSFAGMQYQVTLVPKAADDYTDSPILKEGERSISHVQIGKKVAVHTDRLSEYRPKVLLILTSEKKVVIRYLKDNIDIELGTLSKKLYPEDKRDERYLYEVSSATKIDYKLKLGREKTYLDLGYGFSIESYSEFTIKANFCHNGIKYRYKGGMGVAPHSLVENIDGDFLMRSFKKLGACASANEHTEQE